MIYAFFLISLSMALSLLLQHPVLRLARKYGAVDSPEGRKQHAGAIPRWGGLGIGLAVLGTWLMGYWLSDWLGFVWKTILPSAAWFGVCAVAMTVLGMVDDVVRLRAAPKAFVQLLIGIVTWWSGVRVDLLTNPLGSAPLILGNWSLPITVLWIMAVTNAFNLVDGLDGLASGLALNALIGFSLIAIFRQDTMILYAVAPFLGALLGFLPFNFPRATAFLGDSGAYLLGYLLAVLALLSNQKGATAVVAFGPFLLIALPVVDVVGTMLRRFADAADAPFGQRLRGMFRPDRRHLHYLLVDAGVSQVRTTIALTGLGVLLSLSGVVTVLANDRRLAVLIGLLGVLLVVMIMLAGDRLGRKRTDQSTAETIKDKPNDTNITF